MTNQFRIIHNEQTPAVPKMSVEELLKQKPLLLDFLDHARTKYSNGIGLAANQVEHRFALENELNMDDDEEEILYERFMLPVFAKKDLVTDGWSLVLNPKIVGTAGQKLPQIEYCLTWPRYKILVERFFVVNVEWYDINGEKHVTGHKGFEAQLWQHEICHLEGIMEDVASARSMETANKIGRNEPCPCDSGKKFKKCCINIAEFNL